MRAHGWGSAGSSGPKGLAGKAGRVSFCDRYSGPCVGREMNCLWRWLQAGVEKRGGPAAVLQCSKTV